MSRSNSKMKSPDAVAAIATPRIVAAQTKASELNGCCSLGARRSTTEGVVPSEPTGGHGQNPDLLDRSGF